MTLSCSPRLEKLSLFSPPPPCAKSMAQGFRCLRAAIRATRPEPRQHFWKIAGSKNFWLPAACSRNTTQIRFGKAGAHPQLALGIAIAPETLCSHCNLLILMAIAILCDSLLDFCLRFSIRFYLLRKCGLLAHTSPAFLKNCWIKKLLSACGSGLETFYFQQRFPPTLYKIQNLC